MRPSTLALSLAFSLASIVGGTAAAQAAPSAPAAPPAAPAAKPVALSAAERARYTGVYALMLPSGPRDFTVAEDSAHLTGQLAGQVAFPMIYLGNDTFGVSFDPNLRITFTVEKERAVKMTLDQNGGHFEGARKP